MPKIIPPLTVTRLRTAQPSERDYSLFDGGGLYLLVKPNGKKIWRLKITRPDGKAGLMTIGQWPETSLEDARAHRSRITAELASGSDPIPARPVVRATNKNQLPVLGATLADVLDRWYEDWAYQVAAPTVRSARNRLELHVVPPLGAAPIASIRPRDLIEVLRPLERVGKLATLHQILGHLRKLFAYALVCDLVEENVAVSLEGVFAAPHNVPYLAMMPDEMGALLSHVEAADLPLIGYGLIYWQLLTLVRPVEAVRARWDDIDFVRKLWVIPLGQMKKRREHVVPLSNMALDVLSAMPRTEEGKGWIFPSYGYRGPGHIGKEYVRLRLTEMGLGDKTTAHGFRSLASTTLNESGLWRPDVIEKSLAHVPKDRVRAIYNRAQYLPERQEMLQWWADHIRGHLAQVPNPTGRIPAFLATAVPASPRTDRR